MILYFDGLCEPRNPGGVACYGWLLIDEEQTVASHCGVIEEGPKATNNVAEWCALGFGLRHLLNQQWHGKLTVKGDSQLVINQLTGAWACNAPRLIQFRDRCLSHLEALSLATIKRTKKNLILDVEFKDFQAIWVPRAQNAQADALSNQAYEMYTGLKVLDRRRGPHQWKCNCGKACKVLTSYTNQNPNRKFISCDCGKFTWVEGKHETNS